MASNPSADGPLFNVTIRGDFEAEGSIKQNGTAVSLDGHTHSAADVGALEAGGTAAAAKKLATARLIQVSLASTKAVSFNGTADVLPGVTGTLKTQNGGTGATTPDGALSSLGAVGRSMSGKKVKPTSTSTVTAGAGAEIFNDYKVRTYSGTEATLGNVASGMYAHAEGATTTASGSSSHAEGSASNASGNSSHAEGSGTTASGNFSHAEGGSATASGNFSHAEGRTTTASGIASHSEGATTTASGNWSHSEGYNTKASSEFQHAGGKYNVEYTDAETKFIIGKGTSDEARANCFRVSDTGTYAAGAYNASGADYAELFEWEDGNPENEDRAGLFVTLVGDKLRLASPEDDDILGIVSGNPSIVGDVHDDQWAGMYLYDVFGRPLREDVEVPDETIEEPDPENPGQTITRVIIPAHTEHRQKLNPDYDGTKTYTARSQRPEWVAVGLLGKLVARDDGSCQVNSWCKPAEGGIATASQERTKFRVMRRIDENHVQLMMLT